MFNTTKLTHKQIEEVIQHCAPITLRALPDNIISRMNVERWSGVWSKTGTYHQIVILRVDGFRLLLVQLDIGTAYDVYHVYVLDANQSASFRNAPKITEALDAYVDSVLLMLAYDELKKAGDRRPSVWKRHKYLTDIYFCDIEKVPAEPDEYWGFANYKRYPTFEEHLA
ncbi:hypothetical protein [Endozoicomonas sp. ALB032]|uniref:hypothetical protein n=1 Tax=Endozoicomonas sp. ALB032 TaxID=3403082 RepID=UPI003BB49975